MIHRHLGFEEGGVAQARRGAGLGSVRARGRSNTIAVTPVAAASSCASPTVKPGTSVIRFFIARESGAARASVQVLASDQTLPLCGRGPIKSL